MDFLTALTRQLTLRQGLQPRDIIKFCYQAAFGAEHLLGDVSAAERYFRAEYAAVAPAEEALYEPLSPAVGRISLRAWKSLGLPEDWLFRMFVCSASCPQEGAERFREYLGAAAGLIAAGGAPFSAAAWERALADYDAAGGGAVHHSESYRQQNAPAYRVVSSRFRPLLPLLAQLAALPQTDRARIVAIDGRAASGKTTAAEALAAVLTAGVVHMDDFFLPPELRTAERLAESGGNVHYERFAAEVLPRLAARESFAYGRFDCGQMALAGERTVAAAPYRIVEGCYSCHPLFGDYADVRAFSDIEPQAQRRRIRARDGEESLQNFLTRWIPMEEQYFSAFAIRERAALILRSDGD